jgi:hypothetical protein
MSRGILVLPILQEHEKVPRSTLLEQSHQAGTQGFALVRGDLVDLAITVDERPGDLLEFEVTDDIGVDQHSGKRAAGQNELGDEVDGIVAITTEVVGRRCVPEFLVELGGERVSVLVGA